MNGGGTTAFSQDRTCFSRPAIRPWSHTFAGKGFHKVVNLDNGRASIDYDSRRSYVSCVR